MKNKKQLCLYIIFGVITSILNIVCFILLTNIGLEYKISNLITLIIVKITAYICNKKYVFKSKCNSIKELIKEFCGFVLWRGITLLVDYFGLIILTETTNFDKKISKIIITVLVIVINYITGEKYVFKNKVT